VASKHENALKKVFQISPSTSSKYYEPCSKGLWALDDVLSDFIHQQLAHLAVFDAQVPHGDGWG